MKKPIFIFLIIAFSGCSELLIDDPAPNHNLQEFETCWQIIKSDYAFLEYKKINWDSLYLVYRPQVLKAKGDEIFSILSNMLRELKDGHVDIELKGMPVRIYDHPRYMERNTCNYSLVSKYLMKPFKLSKSEKICYEISPDNIGYICISTFSDNNGWIKEFDFIYKYLSDTKGLIIDVRNNEGGTSYNSDYIISHFIQSPMKVKFYKPGDVISMAWDITPKGNIYI